MRFRSKKGLPEAQAEMTPMIDMAFQLIAFFMVLINFSETVADQTIKLPISPLARPPEDSPQQTVVLNMNRDGRLHHLGQTLEVEELGPFLAQEQQMIRIRREAGVKKEPTIVVIRAHREAPAGKVQELIQLCTQHGFEKFALRAQEREE